MKSFFLILLVMCLGCKSQKKGTSIQDNSIGTPTLILTDNYGGTEEQEIQVIKDMGTLKKFFIKINKTRKPGLPVPEVDFTREMVVIYCSGKTRLKAATKLYKMEETETQLVMSTKITDSTTTSTATITPFSIYKMPLTEKELVLRNLQ